MTIGTEEAILILWESESPCSGISYSTAYGINDIFNDLLSMNKINKGGAMKLAIKCSITTELERVFEQLKSEGYTFKKEPTFDNFAHEVLHSGLDHVFIHDGFITSSNREVCEGAGYRVISAETFLYGENSGIKQKPTKIHEYLDKVTRIKADLHTVEAALLQGRRNGGTPMTDELLDEIKKDPRYATRVLLESYTKLKSEIDAILNKEVIEC